MLRPEPNKNGKMTRAYSDDMLGSTSLDGLAAQRLSTKANEGKGLSYYL